MVKKLRMIVGNYYLVSLGEVNYHSISETDYGKLIEILQDSPYGYGNVNSKQKYFIEFIKEHRGLHEGLYQSGSIGKKSHCYFVTINSIIKKVSEGEILAKEL